jgi:NAD(P)-dependent dehydrogenase (short-subunit alcohol dehydrogenase family)
VRLENQVAIITGASRGIGRVVAQHCAAEGARVVLAALPNVPLREPPGRSVIREAKPSPFRPMLRIAKLSGSSCPARGNDSAPLIFW